MRTIILFLLISLSFSTTACKKDDDSFGCVKDENYFTAEFDGQTLEPYWMASFASSRYTLMANRDWDNQNNWHLSIIVKQPNRIIDIWISSISDIGFYPIEHVTYDDIRPPLYQKNYIQITDTNTTTDDGGHFIYLSMENKSGIEITSYDAAKGILVGTFTCNLYAPSDPSDVKQISGEFNINLSTYDRREKPCWL